MKKNDIQFLLKKYQEGSITDQELSQLNILTHKDEVMSSAFDRANGIIRRRRVGIISGVVAGLMMVGAGIWAMSPKSATPSMIAMTQEVPVADNEAVPEELVVKSEPMAREKVEEPNAVVTVEHGKKTPANTSRQASKHGKKPVVVCNTQCDADAVISDIWKFLSV